VPATKDVSGVRLKHGGKVWKGGRGLEGMGGHRDGERAINGCFSLVFSVVFDSESHMIELGRVWYG